MNTFYQLANALASDSETESESESDSEEENVNWTKLYIDITNPITSDSSSPISLKKIEDMITFLSDLIVKGNFSYPYHHLYLPPPKIMYKNLEEIWRTSYEIFSSIGDENFTLIIDFIDYWLSESITDHFTEHIRMKSRKLYKTFSPMDSWKSPVLNKGVITNIISDKAAFSFLEKAIEEYKSQTDPKTEEFTKFLSSREKNHLNSIIYTILRPPTIFRPSWAMAIFKHLYPNMLSKDMSKIKWLDPSAGWGDRLVTATIMGCQYHGVDPNKDLKPGHSGIIEQFGSVKQMVEYKPFEEVDLGEELYDIAFTSPPFFDIEIYSEQETQSLKRFPSYDLWLKKWFIPSVDKMWKHLKVGGFLALYLIDSKLRVITPSLKDHMFKNHRDAWNIKSFKVGVNPVKPFYIWKKLKGDRAEYGENGKTTDELYDHRKWKTTNNKKYRNKR